MSEAESGQPALPMASTMNRTIGLFKSACCRHFWQLECAADGEEGLDVSLEGGGAGAEAMQSEQECDRRMKIFEGRAAQEFTALLQTAL
jgi:hypothetical protein